MELRIDGSLVLPGQSLEGKFAIVSRITEVFGCDVLGGRKNNLGDLSDYVRVQISNRSDTQKGSSGQIYDTKTFREFKEAYRVKKTEDLVGKSVISVYTIKHGEMLTGLIPLDTDA